ncbi:MAG: hypothetical protein UR69_C0002G0175 [Candidatus Moranbacteria bacterium GW2011_GWE2_35_2-]|nr:MAG: hypothetical protein UR69_C0002G0175 [Candidatus Moranbacteria bacterium GW2011_GWE2_35_2-]KKQ22476.1 MAG: hypothetical protein US37_C0002G0101 [Candidatus Moranbacteria bacterium GW2011_GWF2_37_11]KKQ29545.1 MAG: hypothetical protein US44_C0001G0137 [Candidatus Moranbacteria bacterium GW2011_GWD1_37_17]KKQ30585.1 MAG: hypothetical protein US47_C0002G0175 [Candidatus Moranbacteria bacterium GW2011_GWE1_37_24]KKQ48191.1 MAG: hypothetical protein US66_C0001G0055 [Candidatus Moranbacteria 
MENTKMSIRSGRKIIQNIKWFIFSLTLGLFLGGGLIAVNAWTNPTVAPPGGNIAAPVNVSGITQLKSGRLNMDGSVLLSPTTALLVPVGNVGIGDNSPDVGTGGQLRLDVNGNIGATKYCDAAGNNCKAITEMKGVTGAYFRTCNGNCTVSCNAGDLRTGCTMRPTGNAHNNSLDYSIPSGTNSCTCTLYGSSGTCYANCLDI